MNHLVPPTYRAVRISAAGGPDVLRPVDLPTPPCTETQVLIQVAAAGVNRHDVNQRRRGPSADHSDIPGLEIAGTVLLVGARVTQWSVGDQVCALVDGGGYAQYAVAEAAETLPAPPGLSLIEAAALPEALFTVWHNFYRVARLGARESVLIHGGTSGVGTIAIQLLSALGHDVFATCSSDEKCEHAKKLGARDAFNYRTSSFADAVLSCTQSRGVDVILDMAGGVHTHENIRALARRGRIVHLSPGSGATVAFPLRELMAKQGVLTGSLLRPLPADEKAEIARSLVEKIWPMLGKEIRPVVTRTFALEDAALAHRHLETGEHQGKVVLVPAHGQLNPR
jgi:NADPH:quinone reductase